MDRSTIEFDVSADPHIHVAIKKKHSKTGEESRYQGSVLGKDAEIQHVVVAGGPNIMSWESSARPRAVSPEARTPAASGTSSVSPTPIRKDEDEITEL